MAAQVKMLLALLLMELMEMVVLVEMHLLLLANRVPQENQVS